MAQDIPTLDDRFVRPSEIQSITGLSPTTIWRREREGDFPKRQQISPGAVGWKLSSILSWMDSRQSA